MKKTYALVTLALVLLLGAPSHGQDVVEPQPTLAGLSGIMLEVVPLAPQIEERGITPYVISAEVERRLKEAGIPVLPSGAAELAPGLQTLYVEVLAIFDEYSDQCTWSVRLDLAQAVRLERNRDTQAFLASTWSVGGLGYQTKEWRQGIIDDVVHYTDLFIQEFIASNPDGI